MAGKLITILSLVLVCTTVQGQVRFEEKSLEACLVQAGQENRTVFMDCYTSWCGPCRKMLKEVFTRKDVGDFMNANFICIKQNMEDGAGRKLAERYGIKVYPSFLFLDASGKVVHKFVGGMGADEFIARAKAGLGEHSLEAFRKRYSAGERQAEVVLGYLSRLTEAYMMAEARTVLGEYWASLDDGERCSPETWPVVRRFIQDIRSEEFGYLVNHRSRYARTVGKDSIDRKLEGSLTPTVINHCNDMVFGYKAQDPEILKEYVRLVSKAGTSNREYLLHRLRATLYYLEGNMEKVLKVFCKDMEGLDADEAFNYTLQLNGMLQKKGNSSQCCRGKEKIKAVMVKYGWNQDDILFSNILKGLEEKSGAKRKE